MSQLSPKLRRLADGLLAYWCQGCEDLHSVRVEPSPPGWTYNGNPDAPTFRPSVLVRSGHYVPGKEEKGCWCKYNEDHPGEPDPFTCKQCHTFITDGMVQFLGDCSHQFAGQTLPLPDLPQAYQDATRYGVTNG